jgi:hypothetical protein
VCIKALLHAETDFLDEADFLHQLDPAQLLVLAKLKDKERKNKIEKQTQEIADLKQLSSAIHAAWMHAASYSCRTTYRDSILPRLKKTWVYKPVEILPADRRSPAERHGLSL